MQKIQDFVGTTPSLLGLIEGGTNIADDIVFIKNGDKQGISRIDLGSIRFYGGDQIRVSNPSIYPIFQDENDFFIGSLAGRYPSIEKALVAREKHILKNKLLLGKDLEKISQKINEVLEAL